MRILECSLFGLRAARLSFASSVSGKTVTLFPMVHIGIPEFYHRVYEDALGHDVILFEGVKSPIATWLTRSYRWVVDAKRLGLVVQPKLVGACEHDPRLIWADLSHDEFLLEWRRVPLSLRIFLYLAAPAYGLYQRWFGTVEGLARGHTLDDMPSRDEVLRWTPSRGALSGAILRARDARLVEKLSDLLAAPTDQVRTIAVVYGGAHMRAVIAELTRRGDYIASHSEWLDVF